MSITIADLEPYVRHVSNNVSGESWIFQRSFYNSRPRFEATGFTIDSTITEEMITAKKVAAYTEYHSLSNSPDQFLVYGDQSLMTRLVILDAQIVIYGHFLRLLKRRKVIRRLRMYIVCIISMNNLYLDTLEKTYSPGGDGFNRMKQHYDSLIHI